MVHAGIANHYDFIDVFGVDTGLFASILDIVIYGFKNDATQKLQFFIVKLRKGNARHQISAIYRLRIETTDICQFLARCQIHQGTNDTGCANIKGHTVFMLCGVASLQINDLIVKSGDCQIAVLIPQGIGYFSQYAQRGNAVNILWQGFQDFFEIRRHIMFVERRLRFYQVFFYA